MLNADELAGHIKFHLKDDPEGVKGRLTDLSPQDVADALNWLTTAEAAQVLALLPVLERDGRVVGSVIVDDVIDVMVEEQTEDALRQGAVEPGALDRPYLDMPFWSMVRKRGGWLVILFLGGEGCWRRLTPPLTSPSTASAGPAGALATPRSARSAPIYQAGLDCIAHHFAGRVSQRGTPLIEEE